MSPLIRSAALRRAGAFTPEPGPPPSGITYIDRTTLDAFNSFNATIVKPSGAQADDTLLACILLQGSSLTTSAITPPSGWTLVESGFFDPGSGGARTLHVVYEKTAGASEPANYTFTTEAYSLADATLTVYRGVSAIADSAVAQKTSFDANAAASPAVDVPAGGLLWVAWGSMHNATWTPAGSMTEREKRAYQTVADELIEAGATAATRSATPSGFARCITIAVALSPA